MSRPPPTNATAPEPRPRVVVAGGSGFIGRRLCAVLGGGGYEVVVLSRQAARPAVGPVRFVRWRGTTAGLDDTWPAEIDGARAVINLCGESIGGPRWTASRKASLLASRVEPTKALVAAVNGADQPPRLFVQSSGVGYYGTGEKTRNERSPAGDDFLAGLAAAWEAPLGSLRGDVRPVVARLGVVLGRTGGALAQMLLPFRLFVGGPIATGNQWLSWIHLHDAAALIAGFVEDAECTGIYNLVAPHPVRNAEFAAAAGKALRRPTFMFAPRFVLKALLGEQATLVCDGQRVVSERVGHFPFAYPTLAEALDNLL
ncbi:MAG TPA: TIGR01777 family oxidoreductase [Pseudomonadales bacterium]